MSELVLAEGALDLFDDQGNFLDGVVIAGPEKCEKEWLEGVPHKITNVTFWIPEKGSGMVSVEGYVGSERQMTKAVDRGKLGAGAFGSDGRPKLEPGEYILYNDGSTGIRRTLVAILNQMGLIDVGHENMPETGKLGESRYDLSWAEKDGKGNLKPVWKSFAGTRKQGNIDVPSLNVNINVMTGLRLSDYNNEYGDAVTWYLR